MSASVGPLVPG